MAAVDDPVFGVRQERTPAFVRTEPHRAVVARMLDQIGNRSSSARTSSSSFATDGSYSAERIVRLRLRSVCLA